MKAHEAKEAADALRELEQLESAMRLTSAGGVTVHAIVFGVELPLTADVAEALIVPRIIALWRRLAALGVER
jgi:hypothetical protein